ncbi:uncharacterized protein LOC135388372 [Ornithodoros turicata]|uniref:uncharacterized protein LOC135388372 n=1 Tax=Ornithodoros turicata TaxID=34597 RepID=UPI003139663B
MSARARDNCLAWACAQKRRQWKRARSCCVDFASIQGRIRKRLEDVALKPPVYEVNELFRPPCNGFAGNRVGHRERVFCRITKGKHQTTQLAADCRTRTNHFLLFSTMLITLPGSFVWHEGERHVSPLGRTARKKNRKAEDDSGAESYASKKSPRQSYVLSCPFSFITRGSGLEE